MKVVLDSEFKNWILGAMIRESSLHSKAEITVTYIHTSRLKHPLNYVYLKYLNGLKLDENDLIINHKMLLYLIRNGLVSERLIPYLRCFYTHDSESFLIESKLLDQLKRLKQILVMNRSDLKLLVNLGVSEDSISVVYGAIDRKTFYPSKNYLPRREVLITGDAKGRKNSRKIIEVINQNPTITFVVCGRNWKEYLASHNLENDNYEVFDFSLELTAQLMRRSNTYLTLSYQEGGPYPVLEALASGTPVVSTPVGWAPEIINLSNGVLVNHDSSIQEITEALEKCLKLKQTTCTLDLLNGKYTWEELADKLFNPYSLGSKAQL